jgi:hypothetical protein
LFCPVFHAGGGDGNRRIPSQMAASLIPKFTAEGAAR